MILVTGGAGFIGSRLVQALLADGVKVAVAERFRSSTWTAWSNLRGAAPLADLVREDEVLQWCEQHRSKIEAVVHLGAVVDTRCEDVDLLSRLNVGSSLGLWHLCRQAQIRFIWASSASVYGAGEKGFDDAFLLAHLCELRPLNHYAWSKLTVDRHIALSVMTELPPPQWAGVRFFNVYGPGEDHKGPMMSYPGQLLRLALAGRPLPLFRDGHQRRDFVHVDDCVAVLRWLLASPTVTGCFNVGTGEARSYLELVACLSALVRRPLDVAWLDLPPDLEGRFQAHTRASLGRLRRSGFTEPFRSLEAGLAAYLSCVAAK